MKIIRKNLKNQALTLKIETLDDIWALSQIIEIEDTIKGRTERKIKIGDSSDRNQRIVRKHVNLTVKIEKVELSEDSRALRTLGLIINGPEDVARGEHHSFNLEINSIFTIIKEKWLNYQLEKITTHTKSAPAKILMVVFDREEAYFARLKEHGYNLLGKIKGDVSKKEEKHISKNDFYKEINEKICGYDKTDKLDNIILASPGFWKENLLKIISEKIKKKAVLATVSQTSERAISELLKRDELKKVLKQNIGAQELKMIEELLQSISKDVACYGFKETKEKIALGAVKELLVSYSFLQKYKEKNLYKKLEKVMLDCERMKGTIHIISSEEAKERLDSLSGIAGILRWKN